MKTPKSGVSPSAKCSTSAHGAGSRGSSVGPHGKASMPERKPLGNPNGPARKPGHK